jgi:hypothetical protein
MQNRSPLADTLLFVLIVLACVGGLSAIWKVRFANQLVPDIRPVATEKTKAPAAVAPQPATPQPTNPRIAPPGMMCDEENVICVSKHYVNSLLENPFSVTGTFAMTSSSLEWSVESKQNAALDKGSFAATSSFTIRGGLQDNRIPTYEGEKIVHATSGVLAIYWRDGQGLRQNELRVPVHFPAKMARASYVLIGYNPDDKVCHPEEKGQQLMDETYATTKPVETSLRTMLRAREGKGGMRNPLPDGTQLRSLEVKSGVANVILKVPEEVDVNGNCFQQVVESQVKSTFKQFPSIKSVAVKILNSDRQK